MNTRKLLALAGAAITIGTLATGAAHAQWLTTGNATLGGEILGTTNFMPLDIVTDGNTRINISPFGDISLNGGTTINGPLNANVGAFINGPLNAIGGAFINGPFNANGGANVNGPTRFNGGPVDVFGGPMTLFGTSLTLNGGPLMVNGGPLLANGPLFANAQFSALGPVGLGLNTPVNTVDVNGNMVIGNTYAGSIVAPPSSLLVENELGVAYTTNPLPGFYRLYVNGNTWTNGGYFGSDRRWKENVVTIGGALDKVMQLRGVNYDFRHKDYPDLHFPTGRQVGFIAQEVEKVVPEIVVTNADGYKGVAYQNLTALLTEAIKEQQQTIRTLNETTRKLNARIATLEAALGIPSSQEADPQSAPNFR